MESGNSSLTREGKYEAWRKNFPMLYDVFVKEKLASPSLTVEWLPSPEKRRGRPPKRIAKLRLKQRLVLGTSNDEGDNHLMIAIISFCEKRLKSHIEHLELNPNTITGFINDGPKIKHPGVVNRAKYMPQDPTVLATKSSNGDVYIFDVTKIILYSDSKSACRPTLRLKGLTSGGNGLSWNPNHKGYILSCSNNDRTIRHWDINTKPNRGKISSLNYFNQGHRSGVRDVSWHRLHPYMFGSVGNDKNVHIWDVRADCRKRPEITAKGHKSSVNCISFNYFSEFLLASGSSDQTVAIWDLRNMRQPCHSLIWDKVETSLVDWSPNNETILASSGVDHKVLIWDISEIGTNQDPEDAKEGPPELLFIHGGHKDNILHFSWNITEPWLLSSVSQDKDIQVWQMEEYIYDCNTAKKLLRMKGYKHKDSSQCQAVPGTSKSFLEPSSQTYLSSQPADSSTDLGLITSENLIDAQNTANSSVYPILTNLLLSTSQQSMMSINKSEEVNLEPEYRLLSDPTSPLFDDLFTKYSLPSLSPMSLSSHENFPQSITPSALPTLPTSMKLPKSLTYLDSQSHVSSQSHEPANIMEATKTSDNQVSHTFTNLPDCPPSIAQESIMSTCKFEEASEYLTTPELTKSLDLAPDYLLFPDSTPDSTSPFIEELLTKPTLPCLSPKSLSLLEDSPDSIASPVLPIPSTSMQLPKYSFSYSSPISKSSLEDPPQSAVSPKLTTSMESQKALDSPCTPKSCKSLFSQSDPPRPLESTKAILLPSLIECSEPPNDSEDIDNKVKQEAESSIHPNLSKFPKISSVPVFQSDYSTPMSSHLLSSDAPVTVDYQNILETQNSVGNPQYTDIKTFSDTTIYVDELDIQLSEEVVTTSLSDDSLTSPTQEHQDSSLSYEDTESQHSLIPQENYLTADDQNHLNSPVTPNMKTIQDINDSTVALILLDFSSPPVSPMSQHINMTQHVSVYPEITPNIQESQSESVSSDGLVSINNLRISNIPSHSESKNLTESSNANIVISNDRPLN